MDVGHYCVTDIVYDSPVIRCPKCGGFIHLSPAHTIAPDGKVSPRVRCPWVGCDWLCWPTLESYWVDP